jgi:hypothetical protein
MMKRAIIYQCIVLLFTGIYACSPEVKESPSNPKEIIPSRETITELNAIMDQQEDAWNMGQLDRFMEGYWKSDSLLFVGSNGLRRGWQTTLDGYKKGYPSREDMGELQFDNTEYKALGADHFLIIGKWTLLRSTDTISGHYSLVWEKRAEGWVIIADHSS